MAVTELHSRATQAPRCAWVSPCWNFVDRGGRSTARCYRRDRERALASSSVTKKARGRTASVFGAIVVLLIVGLAVRSCSPSRTVGHGAVEEACFDFWRLVRIPNSAAAHRLVELAQDAASRSQDRVLVADVSRVSKTYAGKGTGVSLSAQVAQNTLAECEARGWTATDPCTYGAAVCGSIDRVTTTTS
jgi:hypothetical protein